MLWKNHSELSGTHALLGASQNSWLNYSESKVRDIYDNQKHKQLGTELHALASSAIKHGVKLSRAKQSINQFVNDAIKYKMESEQVLYYSDVAFGTADAICFRNGLLRIHDLKTGYIPVKKFNQINIYAALFCLEYDIDPQKISIIERFYQFGEVHEQTGDPFTIGEIMEKIESFSDILIALQEQEGEI